jgi:hypothetical protein
MKSVRHVLFAARYNKTTIRYVGWDRFSEIAEQRESKPDEPAEAGDHDQWRIRLRNCSIVTEPPRIVGVDDRDREQAQRDHQAESV